MKHIITSKIIACCLKNCPRSLLHFTWLLKFRKLACTKEWVLFLFWGFKIIIFQFGLPSAGSFLSHLTLKWFPSIPSINLPPNPQPSPSQLMVTPSFQFLGPYTLKLWPDFSLSHLRHSLLGNPPCVYLPYVSRIWSLLSTCPWVVPCN